MANIINFGNEEEYYDGSTVERAAPSALYIKLNTGTDTNGLYWLQNDNINSGNPFQAYCDMNTSGGGWILIVCNSSYNGSTKLNYTNYSLYNQTLPSLESSYSILAWADYLKSSSVGFQYMMEAGVRGQLGGIWTANQAYSFTSTSNGNTDITMNEQFGNWVYNNSDSIEARMPWVDSAATTNGKLTTSVSSSSAWWGTIIEASSSFSPAPWIATAQAGSDYIGPSDNPLRIWYWVR